MLSQALPPSAAAAPSAVRAASQGPERPGRGAGGDRRPEKRRWRSHRHVPAFRTTGCGPVPRVYFPSSPQTGQSGQAPPPVRQESTHWDHASPRGLGLFCPLQGQKGQQHKGCLGQAGPQDALAGAWVGGLPRQIAASQKTRLPPVHMLAPLTTTPRPPRQSGPLRKCKAISFLSWGPQTSFHPTRTVPHPAGKVLRGSALEQRVPLETQWKPQASFQSFQQPHSNSQKKQVRLVTCSI